jgi:hypothetical protein
VHISASSSESQKLDEIREGFNTRGTLLEIKVRNKIVKLGPHPHILLPTFLLKLCTHVLIRSNRRHGRKERAVHRLTNTESCRSHPPNPASPRPLPPTHNQLGHLGAFSSFTTVWSLDLPRVHITTYALVIYTALCIMFWRRGYTLLGEVGGGWALEFPSFLGPKWHRAQKTWEFQGATPSNFPT